MRHITKRIYLSIMPLLAWVWSAPALIVHKIDHIATIVLSEVKALAQLPAAVIIEFLGKVVESSNMTWRRTREAFETKKKAHADNFSDFYGDEQLTCMNC